MSGASLAYVGGAGVSRPTRRTGSMTLCFSMLVFPSFFLHFVFLSFSIFLFLSRVLPLCLHSSFTFFSSFLSFFLLLFVSLSFYIRSFFLFISLSLFTSFFLSFFLFLSVLLYSFILSVFLYLVLFLSLLCSVLFSLCPPMNKGMFLSDWWI